MSSMPCLRELGPRDSGDTDRHVLRRHLPVAGCDDHFLYTLVVAVRRVSASESVLYRGGHRPLPAMVFVVSRAGASETADAVIEPQEGRVIDGISSAGGRSSRGHIELPRHQISRAFIPPCIHQERRQTAGGLPLSDQPPACAGRNPRRTLLVLCVQVICRGRWTARCVRKCLRNRDLGVAVACTPRTVFEQSPIQLPENGIRPGRVSATAPDRFALRRSRGCGPGSDPSDSGIPACASFPAHASRPSGTS